jgi:hypothetical protein
VTVALIAVFFILLVLGPKSSRPYTGRPVPTNQRKPNPPPAPPRKR